MTPVRTPRPPGQRSVRTLLPGGARLLACCGIAAALAVPAASGPRGRREPRSGPSLTVTLTGCQGAAKLRVGDELVLRLESNPSTGHAWILTGALARILEPLDRPLHEPSKTRDPTPAPPGAGGWQVLRFRAAMAGAASLEFHYARAWEKARPPAQVCHLPVTVVVRAR